jgi:hypothetical protein
MCLWCRWKDLDEQDLMEFIYLVTFGFRNVRDIDFFKRFLLLKIQINSKKPGFQRKNQFRLSPPKKNLTETK